jgi:hypothetical protein
VAPWPTGLALGVLAVLAVATFGMFGMFGNETAAAIAISVKVASNRTRASLASRRTAPTPLSAGRLDPNRSRPA